MKKFKFIVFILSILISAFFLSCDDSGVIHSFGIKGTIYFRPYNLPHLTETVDGYYELWVRLDSSGIGTYFSCGKFNIGYDGSVINTAGEPMTFSFSGDTNNLYRASVALITVEPFGTNNTFPGPIRLMSCGLTLSPFADSIYGAMSVTGDEAMGSFGYKFTRGQDAHFTVMTPTGSNLTCLQGLWFCNSDGSAGFPTGMNLPPNFPWIYEGWVIDTSNPSNPIYYSTGRFTDPCHADLDSAGPCLGPNQGFDKPGQDWVEDSCLPGKPKITNLVNGHYIVIVTLEPANEQPGTAAYNTPFPLRLYGPQPVSSSCNIAAYFYNRWIYVPPKAFLKIIY